MGFNSTRGEIVKSHENVKGMNTRITELLGWLNSVHQDTFRIQQKQVEFDMMLPTLLRQIQFLEEEFSKKHVTSKKFVEGQVLEEVQSELKRKITEVGTSLATWSKFLDGQLPLLAQRLGEVESREKDLRGKLEGVELCGTIMGEMEAKLQDLQSEMTSFSTSTTHPAMELCNQQVVQLTSKVHRLQAELEERTEQLQRLQAECEYRWSPPTGNSITPGVNPKDFDKLDGHVLRMQLDFERKFDQLFKFQAEMESKMSQPSLIPFSNDPVGRVVDPEWKGGLEAQVSSLNCRVNQICSNIDDIWDYIKLEENEPSSEGEGSEEPKTTYIPTYTSHPSTGTSTVVDSEFHIRSSPTKLVPEGSEIPMPTSTSVFAHLTARVEPQASVPREWVEKKSPLIPFQKIPISDPSEPSSSSVPLSDQRRRELKGRELLAKMGDEAVARSQGVVSNPSIPSSTPTTKAHNPWRLDPSMDLETKKQKAREYLAFLGQQKCPTAPAAPTAQVLMMRAEPRDEPVRGGVWSTSFLNGFLPTIFDGTDEDWPRFSKAWFRYAKGLEKVDPRAMADDYVKLGILQSFLDPTSKRRLEELQDRDPNLTFDHFWGILERSHLHDLADEYRRRWEELSFKWAREPTLKDFRGYVVEWTAALGKVTGVGSDEAARKFLGSLPTSFLEEVSKEQIARMRGKHWVIFEKNGVLDTRLIKEWGRDMLESEVRVLEDQNGFLCELYSFEDQQIFVACDGVVMGGAPVRVQPYSKKMTHQEIAEYVESLLKIQEMVQKRDSEAKAPKDFKKSTNFYAIESQQQSSPPPRPYSPNWNRGEKGQGKGWGGLNWYAQYNDQRWETPKPTESKPNSDRPKEKEKDSQSKGRWGDKKGKWRGGRGRNNSSQDNNPQGSRGESSHKDGGKGSTSGTNQGTPPPPRERPTTPTSNNSSQGAPNSSVVRKKTFCNACAFLNKHASHDPEKCEVSKKLAKAYDKARAESPTSSTSHQ